MLALALAWVLVLVGIDSNEAGVRIKLDVRSR